MHPQALSRPQADLSKHVGANVEGGLNGGAVFSYLCTVKRHKRSQKDKNRVLTIKKRKGMKKMMIALVAMFVMTMSANAQSVNDSKLSFDKLSSYLDLRVDQVEQVKTAMAQFTASMEAYNQVKETPKAAQAWERIQAAHKSTMKKVLDEKQYQKYEQTLNLTIRNTAERLMEEATANR